ncbi:hypothetical protein ACX5I6_09565 [Arthrobacter sp. MMS24-T111]
MITPIRTGRASRLLVQEPGGEEKRIPGQEREQDAGFDEDHPGDHAQGCRSQAAQQAGGVQQGR